jgi:hypothetical protein
LKTDGGGKYETFVVISMLADQIDASRRLNEQGFGSIELCESLYKLNGWPFEDGPVVHDLGGI